jgi:ketosteroid isomerase-like protein
MSDSADELAIRDLAARYIDAVNRYHQQDWAATWSETASWNLMGMEVEGRDNIVQLWAGAMGSFDFALMMLNSGTITVAGDSASGRWYVTEHINPKEGDPNITLGVYDDTYCREDGQWLFKRRHYNVMYQGAADYSGNYTPYRPDADGAAD